MQQNGIITGYIVQVVQVVVPDHDSPIIVHAQEVSANTESAEIGDLKLYTSYKFKISAKTRAGIGPSASVIAKTPEAGKTNFSTKRHSIHLSLPTKTLLAFNSSGIA